MKIRLAEINDLDRMEELYRSFFIEASSLEGNYFRNNIYNRGFLKAVLISQMFGSFVAEDGGQVVAFIIVQEDVRGEVENFIGTGFGHIVDLVVDPTYEKNGLGKKLIQEAIKWTRERELDFISMDSLEKSRGAIKLYENLGLENFLNSKKFNTIEH